MRAAVYQEFAKPLTIQNLADPTPSDHGVVICVKATGLCRSDWHGWMGHDPDIRLPHVPGHELAGVIAATGKGVVKWKVDDRVTLPFVCGCGICSQCTSGNHQVCHKQFQPGFTHWGSMQDGCCSPIANIPKLKICIVLRAVLLKAERYKAAQNSLLLPALFF